jgi:hypothetical protein
MKWAVHVTHLYITISMELSPCREDARSPEATHENPNVFLNQKDH